MPGKIFQLFLKGVEGQTNIIHIDEDATIHELRKKVSEVTQMEDTEVRVLYCSKDLRAKDQSGNNQTLKDYDMCDQSNLFVVLLFGGSENVTEEQPIMYASEIRLTDKPDMFTMDDDKGGQRAEMPCGHAVGPESLKAWCRSLLDDGKYEFRCPYKTSASDPLCGHLWEIFTVKRLAVLTQGELKAFEKKVTENYLRNSVGIQNCPNCQSYFERKSKNDARVICPICTRKTGELYEFCWFCLNIWLTCGTNDCGNVGCTGVDPRLHIVRNCSTKTVVDVPNCPAIRACPTCGQLIEHMDAGNQMECPCGQKFCFICLTTANTAGQYQCVVVYNSRCKVAAVQTTIPGN